MSGAVTARKTSANKYTPEEVDLGLTALAAVNGNSRRANRELAAAGVKIPHATLDLWAKKTHKDRYLELREEVLPHLKARMAEQLEQVVFQGSDLQARILTRLSNEMDDLDPKDLGKSFQQVSIGTGIASQRAGDLRGDEQVIRHTHDHTATLAGLQRLGLIPQDTTAEDITDAEVVPSLPPSVPSV